MTDKTSETDYEGLAAEYVLGTLDTHEKQEAEYRMSIDPDFRSDVLAWRRRLSPLLDSVPSEEPSPGVLAEVLQRIHETTIVETPPVEKPADPESIIRFWRGATIAASLLACLLLAGLVGREYTRPAIQNSFVAVLETNDRKPAFVASIDLKNGLVHVLRVGAAPQADKSFELWAVGAGRAVPESLGVLDEETDIAASRLGKLDRARLQETVFAISLEPKGGSPTGKATGPVLFTGRLVPLNKSGSSK